MKEWDKRRKRKTQRRKRRIHEEKTDGARKWRRKVLTRGRH